MFRTALIQAVLVAVKSNRHLYTVSFREVLLHNVNPPGFGGIRALRPSMSSHLSSLMHTQVWYRTPNFYAVIPAGDSKAIPQGTLSNIPGQGRGFNWTVNIKSQETVILVGGDSRGSGVGGSAIFTVQQVIGDQSPVTSCLSDSSPSRTPGSPAGGAYPTEINANTPSSSPTPGGGGGGGTDTSSGGSRTNIGAIVGQFLNLS